MFFCLYSSIRNKSINFTSMVVEEAKSTMGTNAEEEKMVIVRFGDLQTMRRVRTGKRLLMKKKQMAAATEAEKSLPVSPAAALWC